MSDTPVEIADVIGQFIEPYRQQYGHLMLPSHQRAMRDILGCMTPAMGGGRYQCQDCTETFWVHHGCRNRACPKCHGRQIALWMEKRQAELLPCDYFHLVATVPAELRRMFLREQKLCYGILMKTVAAALCELTQDRRYLGATPAILATLHTWTGQMHYHPHIHLLVSAGGLADGEATWRQSHPKFLVPVKKLSPLISQRFATDLQKQRPDLYAEIPSKVWKKAWCSFCKPAGSGQQAILQYLSRYVFRIAITKNRILDMDQTHVTFRYKDNAQRNWRIERIPGVEFIRRFLLHVLPRGFHKVRYYGLWSATNQTRRATARVGLQLAQIQSSKPIRIADLAGEALKREAPSRTFVVKCPRCKSANVLLLDQFGRRGIIMMVT